MLIDHSSGPTPRFVKDIKHQFNHSNYKNNTTTTDSNSAQSPIMNMHMNDIYTSLSYYYSKQQNRQYKKNEGLLENDTYLNRYVNPFILLPTTQLSFIIGKQMHVFSFIILGYYYVNYNILHLNNNKKNHNNHIIVMYKQYIRLLQ